MISDPIFIVGPPRSGTTLLARMLDRHPHIYMPLETPFLESGRWDLYMRAIEDNMRRLGKERWGNNSHRDVLRLRQIYRIWPNARVILCVRHVLDWLVSYRDMWHLAERERRFAAERRQRRLYHPITAPLLWRRYVNAGLAEGRAYICRYENLVKDPRDMLEGLCMHIHVDYDDAMLSVQFNNSSNGAGRKGIYTDSVDQWERAGGLDLSDAWLAQRLCSKPLRRLRYPHKDTVYPDWTRIAAQVASFPLHVGKVLIEGRR